VTSGEIRRVGALKTSSFAEAQDFVSTNPMVKTDRLSFELHAWMIAKNILPRNFKIITLDAW
jgi:hypothetical protein